MTDNGDARWQRLLGAVPAVAAVVALMACDNAGGTARHQQPGPLQTGAAASCAGPRLSVAPVRASPGATVLASGEWFAADCFDTGQPGTPPALTGLEIDVSQGGRTWTLATGVAASGTHYAFRVSLRLPEALRPGAARVAVKGQGAPVTLHVVRGAS